MLSNLVAGVFLIKTSRVVPLILSKY